MTRHRRPTPAAITAAAAAVAAASVGLAGCGAASGAPEAATTTADEPPILTYPSTEFVMEARMSGRLAYMRNLHCLAIELAPAGDGLNRYEAVFPPGSTARYDDAGRVVVDIAGFGEVTEGAWLISAGGFVSRGRSETPDEPARCSADGETYAVLQGLFESHPTSPPPS
jgi:hypothetical protein